MTAVKIIKTLLANALCLHLPKWESKIAGKQVGALERETIAFIPLHVRHLSFEVCIIVHPGC